MARWLRRCEEEARAERRPLAIDWRTFSLEQANARGPDDPVWERPDRRSRGVPSLAAAQAAKRLDPTRFAGFHMALYEARHEAGADLADPAVLDAAAAAAGYPAAPFAEARLSAEAWREVGRDHDAAVARGVFGVPTLVAAPGALFVKMQPLPDGDPALPLLEEMLDFQERNPFVLELKAPESVTARPRP